MRINISVIVLFVFFSRSGISQELPISDTLLINEISLDTVKFYLFEDLSKLENTLRDTVYLNIEGKIYKVPFKINAQTIVDYQKQYQNYKLTGISLYANPELQSYIQELFRQPRTKLIEKISVKDWTKSTVYLRYFEPYDKNSPNFTGNNAPAEYDQDELEDEDQAVENYENFPLPETIDIFVDLRGNPKTVTILGLVFDFDKLDKRFQKVLMGYGGLLQSDRNRKSNLK